MSKAFTGVESGQEARKRHAYSRMIIVTILNVRKYRIKITVIYQSCYDVHSSFALVWRAQDYDATKSILAKLGLNRKRTTPLWIQMIVV